MRANRDSVYSLPPSASRSKMREGHFEASKLEFGSLIDTRIEGIKMVVPPLTGVRTSHASRCI